MDSQAGTAFDLAERRGDPSGALASEGEQLLARLTAALRGTMDRLLDPADGQGHKDG